MVKSRCSMGRGWDCCKNLPLEITDQNCCSLQVPRPAGNTRAVRQCHGLAAVLREGFPGLAEPLWDRLPSLPMPLQFVAGQLDAKFAALAPKMASVVGQQKESDKTNRECGKLRNRKDSANAEVAREARNESNGSPCKREAVIVEGCGHAVHMERPEALLSIIRNFVLSASCC